MTLDEVLKDIEKVSGKNSIMRGVEVKDIESNVYFKDNPTFFL